MLHTHSIARYIIVNAVRRTPVKIRLLCLFCLLCLLPASLRAQTPDPDLDLPPEKPPVIIVNSSAEDVIKLMVRAYGGEPSIRNTSSFYGRGRIDYLEGDRVAYSLYITHSRRFREDILHPSGTEFRILRNQFALLGYGRVSSFKADALNRQKILFAYKALTMPYGLVNGMYRIRGQGMVSLDTGLAYVLGVKDLEGPYMDVYVDYSSGLIVQVSALLKSPDGTLLPYAYVFSDFRPLGETRLPATLEFYTEDILSQRITFQELQSTPMISDSLFF